MKKIKILHVGLSSNLGGIEKYLINIGFNQFRVRAHNDIARI